MELDKECVQNPEEKTVVDERCYCGHLMSEHSTRWDMHVGACTECDCKRFTWWGWVFKDGSEA